MSRCEKQAYDLLIKIEKEITWEKMMKLKQQIWLSQSESDEVIVWENPHLNPEFAKNQEQPAKARGLDESFQAIQNSANSFMLKKNRNQKQMTEIGEKEDEDED